jgi:hypothetical protein
MEFWASANIMDARERYRLKAQQCLRAALTLHSSERLVALDIAQSWINLADHLERSRSSCEKHAVETTPQDRDNN